MMLIMEEKDANPLLTQQESKPRYQRHIYKQTLQPSSLQKSFGAVLTL